MRILLIEPYYGGSHRAWADGYRRFSRHTIDLLTLPAQFWKWRMQGGAVTLARQFNELAEPYDLILASDMFNVATFRALTRTNLPIALYFHENQLTYPQNSRQNHGWRYGFINYVSAMAADAIYFNSQFHLDEFFKTLPNMLKHFGDFNELETVDILRARAHVLPLGLDLRRLDAYRTAQKLDVPLLVWNHRWEEDKNPRLFVQALDQLAAEGVSFKVAFLGENPRQSQTEFHDAARRLQSHIIHFGHTASLEEYARWLWRADYIISTSYQDFFGGAVAEGIYCRCVPILPRRLNYPALIPSALHNACLYSRDRLVSLLRRHLSGEMSVDTALTRAHIAQFDWSIMAPHYNDVLQQLVQNK